MKLGQSLAWIISVLINCKVVFSLNILAVLPYPGKSHFIAFEPYLVELAKRGHNLTVISYFPQHQRIENYHDISLAGKIKAFEGAFPIHRSYWAIIQVPIFVNAMGRENCEVMLADEKVQRLWQSKENFDVVVIELFNSYCALGLAYKLGAPVVGLTSYALMPWHYEPLGIPYNPSYMPYLYLEGGTKPTLYQRIERIIVDYIVITLHKYTCQRVNQNQLQKYFDVPPLEDLVRDIKFTLLYTNFVLNGPSILPANVIEVGGYHVTKPKKLPEDLRKFIEESENGVIYISFGSMLNAASLQKEKLKVIIEVISELPQRVVWKWDEKALPGNPKDVYLSKWLPQNEILAHPKVIAFFSHCGMLGITEAIYHGVPLMGMPVLADQPLNAAAVEVSGLGVQIPLNDLTKESLLLKLKKILDPEFRRRVKELSRVWHDRPASAMDTAIYWTEFAARNKNYTFRSPASTVPLYQYLFLDVIMVLVTILFFIIFVIKNMINWSRKRSVSYSTKVKTK